MAGSIVIAGARSSNITTRVYDAATGALRWTADHGATVYAAHIDRDGNVYTGGSTSAGVTTRKYTNQGSLLWSVNHGDTVRGIALDSQRHVYTTGVRTFSSTTTKKYTNDGTEILTGWPVDHGADTYGICIDSTDHVYVCGGRSSLVTHRKYNSAGTVQWAKDHGATLFAIALAPNNHYVVGGNASEGFTIRIAPRNSGTTAYSWLKYTTFAVGQGADGAGDLNDTVLTAGVVTSSISTYAFPYDTGSNSWTANHGSSVYGLAVDRTDGAIYTTGLRSSNSTTRKYTATGTEITTAPWPLDHGGHTYAIAWSPWTPSIIPGLALPLDLGIPLATFSAAVPGLPVDIDLGLPDSTPQPDPPATAGLYRLFLTGDARLLELPMSGLQCRRRLGESTWLTVDIPTYSAALAAAIAAAPNRELVIYAGFLAGGIETSGEMMRATLTEIRDAREAGHGSFQLTGRVIPTTATVRSHTLTGVRQRGQDDRGRRTVTCAVNPRIRPNHTVTDGLHTFTVGSLLYRIEPAEATMWIVERS